MIDILHHQNDHVLIITLNRSAQRNAMSVRLVDELLGLLDEVEGRDETGCIVVAGAGKGFCAGSDLTGLAAMALHERRAFETASGRLARRINTYPRPILAAVHGFAIGGGLTLAAACDIVVTTASAKWSLPEVPIGLFPAWGLEMVTGRVGRSAARRLAWGIDTIDGVTARDSGLADMVAENPLDEATTLARRLAALPRSQVAAVKDYFAVPRYGEEADRHANRLFMDACATETAAASFVRFAAKVER